MSLGTVGTVGTGVHITETQDTVSPSNVPCAYRAQRAHRHGKHGEKLEDTEGFAHSRSDTLSSSCAHSRPQQRPAKAQLRHQIAETIEVHGLDKVVLGARSAALDHVLAVWRLRQGMPGMALVRGSPLSWRKTSNP